ncbi:MFS transporter [Rhodococcus opacus]|uniref:Putative 4-hydroxybenzoate/protocatechuate transporter n=1 Tax=Rhodococcus opacus (strain B4) TaxID=632772 RepID=C1B289_RHOOB|nr:aromatic acid/H+ symport family MFS transporter [Rhodococcus opacus]BAH50513.1 putative 4-hydroxybenzoate/protocatechuate transporter [Rhodococcus opacus B4]
MTTSQRSAARASTALWVAPLCWVAVLLDGFDLVVLGAVIPSLREYGDWNLSTGTITFISTFGLVGMTIGALVIGTLTDVIGRRRALLYAVAAFSLLTLLCAVAPNPFLFGLFRFLAGVGLGGALPTALALVNEFSKKQGGGSASTLLMTGYHVGAVATAALAIVLIEPFGWRSMFVVGALPAVILIPLMLRYLPESPSYLLAHGKRAEAEAVAKQYGLELESAPAEDAHVATAANPVRALFSRPFLRNSIAIWVTSFMGLLLVYGLNTWLPTIMREAGYDLGASLTFLLILNAGAVVGLLIAGGVANKIGPRTAAIIWFAGAAVFLALLSVKVSFGIYALVFLAGCFVFSAQVLVYAFTSANHPPQIRATALGWSAGVGRVGAICGPILGGVLLGAGYAVPWGFYAFALVGLLGAIAISSTRTVR